MNKTFFSHPRFSRNHMKYLEAVSQGHYYEPTSVHDEDKPWLESLVAMDYIERSPVGGYKPTTQGWDTLFNFNTGFSVLYASISVALGVFLFFLVVSLESLAR